MKSTKTSGALASTEWIGGPPAWAAAVALAILIGIVYVPAVHVPLIYDDFGSIVSNESIESVWPLVAAPPKHGPLNPPANLPTSGRPLVNLSFALNRHFGGLDPAGYHVVNILIHFLSSMLVWAITRRTLRLPYFGFGSEFQNSSGWLALAVATVWALHPLQTEAVIYATQRTELMMAFFYLATIYCSLRYWQAFPLPFREGQGEGPASAHFPGRKLWLAIATLACFCGIASKEVMVSAPLVVLLFERTFIAGSISKAIRNSWPLYCGLAATWILLIATHVPSPHSDSAGFDAGVPAYAWWLTQAKVLLMYLKLAIWPWPLLIHYQPPYLTRFADAWVYVLPLLFIGVATLALLWRNTPVGFLGTWFFAILAPTFVVPIITEIAAERRMYLALLPLVVTGVVGTYRLLVRRLRSTSTRVDPTHERHALLLKFGVPVMALTLVFCFVSTSRLTSYDEEMTLWLDVLKHSPNDPVAHHNRASYLERAGNLDAAVEEYREAVRLDPAFSHAHYNLGILLNQRGGSDEAAKHLMEAARYVPKNAIMRNNVGVALYSAGRNDQAIEAFKTAIELDPSYWTAYKNLGTALQKAGQFQKAATAFETVLQLNPDAIDAYNDLANVYVSLNQRPKSNVILQEGLARARAAGDEERAKKFATRLNSSR